MPGKKLTGAFFTIFLFCLRKYSSSSMAAHFAFLFSFCLYCIGVLCGAASGDKGEVSSE